MRAPQRRGGCRGGGRRHKAPATLRGETREKDDQGFCREVPLEEVRRSWATSARAAARSPSPPSVNYLKSWQLQAVFESTAVTVAKTAVGCIITVVRLYHVSGERHTRRQTLLRYEAPRCVRDGASAVATW
ncbi:hypothetical protein GH5_04589 [Leishmania sp. Ghana 2012 LV757]|uniref:hypothetical protein n=1 Tax=Leishmania sp. Ghana 2012 LV757 TaxID=2803181 RepID=UPI001B5F4EA1|nr:hypothetical protein GH5_04589 [Leishmania sp. Ghana 2012 LV757]